KMLVRQRTRSMGASVLPAVTRILMGTNHRGKTHRATSSSFYCVFERAVADALSIAEVVRLRSSRSLTTSATVRDLPPLALSRCVLSLCPLCLGSSFLALKACQVLVPRFLQLRKHALQARLHRPRIGIAAELLEVGEQDSLRLRLV